MVETLKPTGLLPNNYVSVGNQIKDNAERADADDAIIFVENGDSITWQEIASWTARLANYLSNENIRANDIANGNVVVTFQSAGDGRS